MTLYRASVLDTPGDPFLDGNRRNFTEPAAAGPFTGHRQIVRGQEQVAVGRGSRRAVARGGDIPRDPDTGGFQHLPGAFQHGIRWPVQEHGRVRR